MTGTREVEDLEALGERHRQDALREMAEAAGEEDLKRYEKLMEEVRDTCQAVLDLAANRKATPPAPVFVQLRNARDQPIAIDRTKVLSIEGLGAPASDEVEYCNVYLAMLDEPLVVRGTEEEVVAAVEGEAAYDPTAPGEREAFAKWMSHPRVSVDLDRLADARAIAARQAEDPRIRFLDPTPEEDYLLRALRELTEAIGDALGDSCICPPKRAAE